MRILFVPALLIAGSLLAGCASAPNEPTLTLQTAKSPEQFTACVMPRLQGQAQGPILSQTQRHYRIVVPSSVAADNVIEAYKASGGGKVFVYERSLLTSGFGAAAKACV
ncbi:hypothetical protein [Pseudomonas sp. LS-2]|jgi:hypothetical protein|uniref:hypothetical protein n=1 Tax=Pseudomonas sp. LS-2 TaxID=2315859 RepID=UPI000E70AF18|nr:hypothetical protein [Pseudomonas sp. LS-2]RJX74097.1 hypothetical protein D3M70_27725 [Pseudomonas sp. LS-2]